MVYRFFQDDQEMYSYETERLDGDLSKVGPLDLTQDGGLEIYPFSTYAGRAVDPTHLPTKVKVKGPKRDITDVYMGGGYLVDGKFKDVVELLEPDVHQFFPVELLWTDDTSAGQRYWFFPCNRLDTVDRDKTTKLFRNLWYPRGDGEFVFNRNLIGGLHIWIDKFMVSTIGILMGDEMHDALVAAGITGMGFERFEDTK